jgi:hypothetical protein
MATTGIPVVGPILNRIIGSRNERFVKKYTSRVEAINAREAEMRALTDGELRTKLGAFRARHDKGETSEDYIVEAFAVAREAMDRSVGRGWMQVREADIPGTRAVRGGPARGCTPRAARPSGPAPSMCS